jgi:serine protease AprX
VTGSFVDQEHGATGVVDERTFRGSGTSQAAAVVSGAAALILQQRPSATPDQVKRLLMTTATPLAGFTSQYQGSGEIDLRKALPAVTPSFVQSHTLSKGDGGLDGARGKHILKLGDKDLKGDVDIAGQPLKTLDLAAARSRGEAWVDGSWFGRDLAPAGNTATPDLWSGRTWAGGTWSGRLWAGRTWAGRLWAELAWDGRTWAGRTWAGRLWAGRTWASIDGVDQSFASARWE